MKTSKTARENMQKRFDDYLKNNKIKIIEPIVKLRNELNKFKPEFRSLFKEDEIENRLGLYDIGLIGMDENGNSFYDEEYIKSAQETENYKNKNIFLNQEDLNNLNVEENEMILSLLKYGRKFNIFVHIKK